MTAVAAMPLGFIDRATRDIELFRLGPTDGETEHERWIRVGLRRDRLRGLIGHGDARGVAPELVQTVMRNVYGTAHARRFEEDWEAAQRRRRLGIIALSSR